ncbi:MAG: hypothetical protein ABIT71_25320 [Vicinamibacteraceae bacterium]
MQRWRAVLGAALRRPVHRAGGASADEQMDGFPKEQAFAQLVAFNKQHAVGVVEARR